ncbi:MAG: tripartite tricarboxylate transporter substrate-binding protein, partial [Xanthobacteraceae bacterium]
IMVHSSSHTVSPHTFAKLPFDTIADFTPITPISSTPNVLVISPSKNIRTLQELLAYGRANPGKLNFASAGQGSATHLNAEKFKLAAKIDATNIPFKGSAEAVTEVMAGRVDFTCMGLGSALAFIRDGKLVPIAVSTPKRSPALPNVPTSIEAGLPNSDYIFWMGLFAPAKTPRAIIDRLHAETQKVLALPAVQDRFKPQGIEPMPLSPAEFDALVKREVEANKALAKAAGLKFN